MKAAREQTTKKRYAYVQSNGNFFTPGKGKWNEISLSDLRDLVAATEDYHPRSTVELTSHNVSVTEITTSHWKELGRES